MKISVYSRRGLCRLLACVRKENFARARLISINNVGMESPLEEKFLAQALVLNFDDVADADSFGAFTFGQATQIKQFADAAFAADMELLIHCHAGISRSGAVGLALNDYVNKFLSDNKDDWRYLLESGCENQILPNPHVLSVLSKAFGWAYE